MCWALILNKIYDGGFVGCRKKHSLKNQIWMHCYFLTNYLKIQDIFPFIRPKSVFHGGNLSKFLICPLELLWSNIRTNCECLCIWAWLCVCVLLWPILEAFAVFTLALFGIYLYPHTHTNIYGFLKLSPNICSGGCCWLVPLLPIYLPFVSFCHKTISSITSFRLPIILLVWFG